VDGEEVRVDGTYNEFEGTVASATSITNVDYVGGDAERSYSAGSSTRVYIPVSAERENRLAQGMRAEHSQLDGTHTDITPDSITVAGNIDVNDSSTAIRDSSDNELVKFAKTASAVNEVTVTNAATGSAPVISASGGDSNINVNITPKGTGRVQLAGAGEAQTATVNTSETETNTSFDDMTTPGPAVTATIGSRGLALVTFSCEMSNSGGFNVVSYAVSGANTIAASDDISVVTSVTAAETYSRTVLLTGLTAGSTTFTMKYRVTAGTGTFLRRRIAVVPL